MLTDRSKKTGHIRLKRKNLQTSGKYYFLVEIKKIASVFADNASVMSNENDSRTVGAVHLIGKRIENISCFGIKSRRWFIGI